MTEKKTEDKEQRIQCAQEEVQKVANQILDVFELNRIESMLAVLGMWNIIVLIFKVRYKFSYAEYEKTILNMLKETKDHWN